MAGGYTDDLYILAFDHRGSFVKKFFGISGTPDQAQTATIADAKHLIYEGVLHAVESAGLPVRQAAVLVDEQFGERVARDAKRRGITLAMPTEKSGQDEFDFDYGDDFGAHITEFDPTFSKVLVRYNPEGDAAMNRRQTERLARLGKWLAENNRRFLFELLVPAEPAQLEKVGGDTARYDRELRPALMRGAIEQLMEGGVEPDVWKIEGLDERSDCERTAQLVRSGGRENVGCVVLGRGANQEAVEAWLLAGAGVPGYIGFAIGRTIWWDPLKGFVDGNLQREVAVEQISANYRRMIEVYSGGARVGV